MIDFSEVMQAVADTVSLAEGAPRAYGFPEPKAAAPCFVVGYPDGEIDIPAAMRGGASRFQVPAWYVIGQRTARLEPGALAAAVRLVVAALGADTSLGGVVQSSLVMSARIEQVSIGSVEYLAVRFVIDVFA